MQMSVLALLVVTTVFVAQAEGGLFPSFAYSKGGKGAKSHVIRVGRSVENNGPRAADKVKRAVKEAADKRKRGVQLELKQLVYIYKEICPSVGVERTSQGLSRDLVENAFHSSDINDDGFLSLGELEMFQDIIIVAEACVEAMSEDDDDDYTDDNDDYTDDDDDDYTDSVDSGFSGMIPEDVYPFSPFSDEDMDPE